MFIRNDQVHLICSWGKTSAGHFLGWRIKWWNLQKGVRVHWKIQTYVNPKGKKTWWQNIKLAERAVTNQDYKEQSGKGQYKQRSSYREQLMSNRCRQSACELNYECSYGTEHRKWKTRQKKKKNPGRPVDSQTCVQYCTEAEHIE